MNSVLFSSSFMVQGPFFGFSGKVKLSLLYGIFKEEVHYEHLMLQKYFLHANIAVPQEYYELYLANSPKEPDLETVIPLVGKYGTIAVLPLGFARKIRFLRELLSLDLGNGFHPSLSLPGLSSFLFSLWASQGRSPITWRELLFLEMPILFRLVMGKEPMATTPTGEWDKKYEDYLETIISGDNPFKEAYVMFCNFGGDLEGLKAEVDLHPRKMIIADFVGSWYGARDSWAENSGGAHDMEQMRAFADLIDVLESD